LIPAEEIGGDMYDFLDFDKDRLLMYLGDVTGHGVPAGIVGSIASALFFGYSTQSDLKQIMLAVNNVLKVKTMTNMFMTLVLMEWDKLNRRFRYVSAGHEQILHYRAATADVVLEPAGGIALGMLPKIEAHMKVSEVDFQVGDYLVIYSDGIPEAWKNEKENYGMNKFTEAVKRFGRKATGAEDMKRMILEDVKNFMGGYKQMDDITIMVIKRLPEKIIRAPGSQ